MAVSSQSLDKVARLLNTLAAAGGLTATELADALGEPRSSVYRQLRDLRAIGWVEESGKAGRWSVGVELFRLGAAALARLDLTGVARGPLEELHADTGLTVFLCVARGDRAVCVTRIDGAGVASMELKLGGALPLDRGAAPIVLLAHLSESAFQQWCAAADLDRDAIDQLQARLDAIRVAGHAVSDEDVTGGIAAVGAPIRDHAGFVVGSISASGARTRVLDPGAALPDQVMSTASEISRALGFSDIQRKKG
jgi:DNA-binding IclR family transcriptional regulator